MYSQESMRDYLMRAEELQLNLTDVGENVSDQMLCSVVLKGLPNSFASFVTVFKFSHEDKTFADLKRDILNSIVIVAEVNPNREQAHTSLKT